MLTFDPSFHSDHELGCFLWADETVMRRVRFHIGHRVLEDVARSARPRRYCFHEDEIAEAEAQGLPYILVPRELSREEWEKKYCHAPAAEEKKD
jgi:hypothetical protein